MSFPIFTVTRIHNYLINNSQQSSNLILQSDALRNDDVPIGYLEKTACSLKLQSY